MDNQAAVPLFDAPDAVPENRRFAAAALAALALHLAALAIGLYVPVPHRMGEETGSPEGLTVEIVDPSEIPGANSPAAPAQPEQPAAQASTRPPEPPSVEQPSLEPQSAAPAEPPAADANSSPPDLKPSAVDDTPAPEAPLVPAPPKPRQSRPVAVDNVDPNLFKIQPKPAATSETTSIPAKPAKAAKPDKPQLFSLAVPTPSFSTNEQMPGRSAGVSRPEGITRSGLNDEFGRGVIRALRQTMPPNGQKAQATVRFVLSVDGNLTEVELVRSSGDPALDQRVVFAVKQSNFPIPATNLTALDRQFRVTYVYR